MFNFRKMKEFTLKEKIKSIDHILKKQESEAKIGVYGICAYYQSWPYMYKQFPELSKEIAKRQNSFYPYSWPVANIDSPQNYIDLCNKFRMNFLIYFRQKLILNAIMAAETARELDEINKEVIKHIHDNKRILESIRKRRFEIFN